MLNNPPVTKNTQLQATLDFSKGADFQDKSEDRKITLKGSDTSALRTEAGAIVLKSSKTTPQPEILTS